MQRRRVIASLGIAAAGWPLGARAQARAMPVIGFLGFGSPEASANRVTVLREGLRALGHVEGKTYRFAFRWAESAAELRAHAGELARLPVDVIFATSSTETAAAQAATRTTPIVFATHADPVGVGHVASLSQPGGNTTGLCVVQSELTLKSLELLKEVAPTATVIGVLWSPAAPSYRPTLDAAEAAARMLGVRLHEASVERSGDFAPAIAGMAAAGAGGLFVAASTIMRTERARLAELALQHRLPSTFGTRENVEAGGLMSHSPNNIELTRRSAVYTDNILKGARPADLPVEQASEFQVFVNLRTARALGIAIPAAVLARVDEVIE